MTALSRVTDSLLSQQSLRSIQGTLRSIAEEDRRISSGQKYAVLSDNPLATRRLVTWQRWVERNEKYESNISFGSSRLSASESALDELSSLIERAREIALGQINASATPETRRNSAVEIDALVREAVLLGNRQFGDRFLFGGSRADGAPFSRVGSYVSYAGDDSESVSEIAPGMLFETSVSGVRAFGGFSSEIRGRADLDPMVTRDTPVRLLNGGRGVSSGAIEIHDGLGASVVVDLSRAKTVGDVVDAVNESGFAAALVKSDGKGLEISRPGANLSVFEVNGATTARDLGIAAAGTGGVLVGQDVDPLLQATTPLAELYSGVGVDPAGFTIRNGNLEATISLAGLDTVEDLLNAINTSGTAVVARLAPDGRGLEVLSHLAGADFFVEEAGGSTARDLGWHVDAPATPLARLHGGRGVQSVDGDDFRIELQDGTVLDIDIADAETLGDVVAQIADHPANGGKLQVEARDGPVRLVLTDVSGGAGELSVVGLNGSFAAGGLGLETSSATGTIDGASLAPGGVRLESAFDGFGLLYEGLVESDEVTIRRAIDALDAAASRVLEARATIGGRIRRLEISERRTQLEVFEFQALISQEGDTDLAAAIVRFNEQQTTYQAALQTSARLLQSSILDFLV
ncbi:MAG: flagellar hook-associated protein FlgL [Planctomycetota bacterium]